MDTRNRAHSYSLAIHPDKLALHALVPVRIVGIRVHSVPIDNLGGWPALTASHAKEYEWRDRPCRRHADA